MSTHKILSTFCLALVICAMALPVPAWAQPIPGEYGDAPEGGIAYPSIGGLGNFPTCIDIAGYYVSHDPVRLAWFGPDLDFENGGNGGICSFGPYDLDECWGPADLDGGLINVATYTIDPAGNLVLPCGPNPNLHIGDSCEIVPWGPEIDMQITNLSGMDCLVNVLIDWDRDGRWGGQSACPAGAVAYEHVVQNVPVPDGYVGTLAGLGAPAIQTGPDRGYFWARFTIASHFDPVPIGWDGAMQFDFGESEDYLISIGVDVVAGELGDAPEGVIAYPLSGVFGQFPTCLGGPNGHVLHAGNLGAQFGPSVDLEGNGNADLCNFSQYDNDECGRNDGDSGLMIADAYTITPNLNIEPCDLVQTQALGQPCQRLVWGVDLDIWIENHQADPRWVNAVFDWDNNGHWGEWVTCANGDTGNEHALVDFPIPGGYVGPLSALGPGGVQILRGPGYVWSRFTISDTAVGAVGWDGQGVFGDGETEDYLFRIDDTTGVPVDQSLPGIGLLVEPSFPNPFNPRTEITFQLQRPGAALVTVHDAGGRTVATLADGEFAAGRHSLVWEGQDDAGDRLSSGAYLLRVEAAGEVRSGKLTILK